MLRYENIYLKKNFMQGLYWEACFLHKKPEENPFLYWLSTVKGSHFVRWESGGIIFIPVKKEKKKALKISKESVELSG